MAAVPRRACPPVASTGRRLDPRRASSRRTAAAAMRTTAVQFAKGRMQGTDFTEANCRGVSFFGAYLKDAIFHDADLSYTNMGQANLTGADLSGARLEGAIFSSAILDKVSNIENSDWSEVLLRPDINDSLCALESAKGINPVTGVATR